MARARWHVYLVRTAAGALYCGIARDVDARLAQHRDGSGAKALRGRGPLAAAFTAPVGGLGRALRVEARIKRLPKAQKEGIARDGLPPALLRAARARARAKG